ESATRWARQLEYLTEVGAALSGELELPALLELVAARLRELVDARLVLIALPREGGLEVVSADGEGEEVVLGLTLELDQTKGGRVFQRKRTERVDSILEDPEADQVIARRIGLTSTLYVPLIVRDRAIGLLQAIDKRQPDPRFSADDQRLAEIFAARAAVAVDLS